MSELPDPDSFGDYAAWPGREVHGPGGRVGKVVEIYLDDATDRPEWVLIESDAGSRFVPLAGGSVEGEAIRVAHGPKAIAAAPDFELSKELTQEQERELYEHYSVPLEEDAESVLPAAEPEAAAEPTPEPAAEPAAVVAPDPAPAPETEPEPTATEPAPVPAPVPVPEPATEPAAALPAEGETSEPENQGPPVPPRPEPVAPPPPPPPPPPPSYAPPAPAAAQESQQPPAAAIAGALALALLLLIIIRRRGN